MAASAAAAKVMRFVAMAAILLVLIVTAFAAEVMSKDVNAREHLSVVGNPSKEVQMISMRGKKLLQVLPSYVHLIYTDTTSILICTDVRCNGIPVLDKGDGVIPGIADGNMAGAASVPIATYDGTTFDFCPNNFGCSCTNEGDPDDQDTLNGYYCKWTPPPPPITITGNTNVDNVENNDNIAENTELKNNDNIAEDTDLENNDNIAEDTS